MFEIPMQIQLDPAFPAEKITPILGSAGSCGFDLAAAITEPVIVGNKVVTISTGIKLQVPVGVAPIVLPRSSAGSESKPHFGLQLANTAGVIDTDYRGYILLKVVVPYASPIEINPYDRIAQLVLLIQPSLKLEVVSELNETKRGASGFGGSGRGN